VKFCPVIGAAHTATNGMGECPVLVALATGRGFPNIHPQL